MEADYVDNSIHYTDPQVQKPSWVVTFADLDKQSPHVVFRHSGGTYELKGVHGINTEQKTTLIALFDDDEGLAAFTIFRETGIAVYSWQGIKIRLLEIFPRVRSAMGTCQ